MSFFRQISLENAIKALLAIMLFLFPWPTIWVYTEQFLNGIKWEYGTLGFYASEILIWIIIFLFIIWFLKKLKSRERKAKFSFTLDRILALGCLFFVSYALLSVYWAGDRSVALQHSMYIMEGALLFFILLVGPLGWQSQMKWFVIGSVVPSILGIWQFLTQSTFAFKWLGLVSHPAWEAGTSIVASPEVGRWLRSYGSFSHPNVFGGYLVVALIFTSLLFFLVKEKRHKIALMSVYLLQLTALFFTFSRSAWIGFILLTMCFIILAMQRLESTEKKHITYYASLIVILILIFIGLFHSLVQVRIFGESVNEAFSISERVGGYTEALAIVQESPWLGAGAGNYTLASYNMEPGLPGWVYQPVHNALLLIIIELGIIGFIFFILMFMSLVLFDLSHCISNEDKRKILMLILLLLAPIFVLSLFDHYLFSSFFGIILSAIYLAIMSRVIPQALHS